MYSYYVYYRVDPGRAAACEPKIRELLAAVKNTTGIAGRLLKKRGEPLLWMEIYENVSDAAQFEPAFADAMAKLEVEAFLLPGSGRHTECFIS
ncbi:MAG TPA: DUF4936 family protein [Burkholderiales bacterium]|nr:DUF4936 family protein [Burkholderiales bacterium]